MDQSGHLPPYAWTVLSIYFLQAGASDGPLLPPNMPTGDKVGHGHKATKFTFTPLKRKATRGWQHSAAFQSTALRQAWGGPSMNTIQKGELL